MSTLLKEMIQLSPLWSLSLMAFVPLTAKLINDNKEMKAGLVCSLYALGLFCSLVLFMILGFNDREVLFLKFDAYSSGACLLVGMASLISLALFYLNNQLDKRQLTEILFFFCQGVLGLYVFCLAQELMTAFIGLETLSLSLYLNIAMSRKRAFCLEAAIKYFILSALAGVIFLYGLSFLFGSAGTLELAQFFLPENKALIFNRFFFLGFALVFSALFFKVALFPFQFWLADVYQGALTPVTCFMATAVKGALVLFIGKLFALPFFEPGSHGFVFLSGLGLASILTVLFGNILACRQVQLKRLAAFSSLAHSGYLMMTLYGILNLNQEFKDFSVIFYYLLAYIFMTSALFLGIQTLEKEEEPLKLADLRALFKSNPLMALALSLFLLALAGMPPSFGFFAKIASFQPLILSASWWVLFWAFVGSAIGLYYYIKPLLFMLDSRPPGSVRKWHWLSKLLFFILAIMILLGPLFFGIFFKLS